jgi:hypothetical protein
MNRDIDEEVGQIVTLIRLCQSLNVLPLPGGLFDQDSYFVYLLQLVLVADAEKAKRDAKG